MAGQDITRDQLAQLLNEDLSREYQAIIAYVVYSQVLKGAEYMNIAAQLEEHAHQELQHALIISRQIDYLGAMPSVTPKLVKTSQKARDMLSFDLDIENETIRNYRDRIRQCEALGEFASGRADQGDPCAGSRITRSILSRRSASRFPTSARDGRAARGCVSGRKKHANHLVYESLAGVLDGEAGGDDLGVGYVRRLRVAKLHLVG